MFELIGKYKKVIKPLESVQRRAMKVMKFEGKQYEEWMRSLNLFSPERRRLRQDFIEVYKFLMKGKGGPGTALLGGQQ